MIERRWWLVFTLALVAVALAAGIAIGYSAPRPAAQAIPSGTPGASRTDSAPLTGVPLPSAGVHATAPSGTPLPSESAMTIEVATARNPRLTPPPEGIGGQATWWDSWGPGLYAAIRPDLGSKGDTAIVCGGQPFHCLTLPITTTCACLGPGSGRLIDLSLDAFRSFADPSAGVVHVTVQVIR